MLIKLISKAVQCWSNGRKYALSFLKFGPIQVLVLVHRTILRGFEKLSRCGEFTLVSSNRNQVGPVFFPSFIESGTTENYSPSRTTVLLLSTKKSRLLGEIGRWTNISYSGYSLNRYWIWTHAHNHPEPGYLISSGPEPLITENARALGRDCGRTRLFERGQSTRLVFSANQICQIWREVWGSRSSVQRSRFLVLTNRIAGSGDEIYPPRARWNFSSRASFSCHARQTKRKELEGLLEV